MKGVAVTDLAPDSSVIRKWRRASLMLLLLIATYAAFNVTLDPIGATDEQVSEYLGLPLMGAMLAQPIMFAIWAALAEAAAAVRLPLSLSAASAVFLASAVKRWNLFRNTAALTMGEEIIGNLAVFGLTLILMLAARYVLRWKIRLQDEKPSGSGPSQFSLKYLLALTTICAVLLVAGKTLAIAGFSLQSSSWGNMVSETLSGAGLFLLALFPLMIIPLTAIAERPSLRSLAAMPFLWMALTWLAVEIIAQQHNEPRLELARDISLFQSGALATSLLSAAALRIAGYRLVNEGRKVFHQPVRNL